MPDNETAAIFVDEDLQREFSESNGNGSLPVVSTTQANQSSETGSAAEEPKEQTANSDTRNTAEPKEDKSTQGCSFSSVKKASRRAASVFTVENPHNIDCHARTLFPVAFLVVNIFYWLYYLFLWAFFKAAALSFSPSYYLHIWGLDPDLLILANWFPVTHQSCIAARHWTASFDCSASFLLLGFDTFSLQYRGKAETIHDCSWIYFDLKLILYKINLKKKIKCLWKITHLLFPYPGGNSKVHQSAL